MIERIYTYDQIKTLILHDYVKQNLPEIQECGLDKKGSCETFTQLFTNTGTGELEYMKIWCEKIKKED